ncbi:MAG: hypothetical protein KF729_14420 [Sandaracinaceae bacterium]|nr:hypothetical protein [Sandaracinaceae bacterium]
MTTGDRGYRDETETLRARVTELERALGHAEETIARLTRGAPERADGVEEHATRSAILGGPGTLRLERVLDFELGDEGLVAIAELLRARGRGRIEQVGRTLTAPGFTLRVEDGTTHLALRGLFDGLGPATLATSALGGGFVALATLAIVHDFVWRGLTEAHALWMIPLGIVLAFFALRPLYRQRAERAERETRGLFEALVEVARQNAVAAPPRARVALDEEPATETEPAERAADEPRARRAP